MNWRGILFQKNTGLRATRFFLGKHEESGGSGTITRKFTINIHPPLYFRRVVEEVYMNKEERWGGMFVFLPVGQMVVMSKHSSRHQLEWTHECSHTAMSLPCAHAKSFSKVACRTPAQRMCQKLQKSRASKTRSLVSCAVPFVFGIKLLPLWDDLFSRALFTLTNLPLEIVKSVKHKSTNITFTTHSHRMALWAMLSSSQLSFFFWHRPRGLIKKGTGATHA